MSEFEYPLRPAGTVPALPPQRNSDEQDRLKIAESLLREWYALWEDSEIMPRKLPNALHIRTALFLRIDR